MNAQAPAKNTETAVQAWTPSAVELAQLLPAGINPDQVNLLVPSMAIRQVNPYLVPDVEMVKLDTGDNSKDIYHSNDMKAGEFAPTARALSKIANVAGVDVIDSRRIDDGKDPDIVEWRVVIQMRLPSGQLVTRAGTKAINLRQLKDVPGSDGKPKSLAWLNKMRENLISLAETKAFNRALRSMLSLQGAMPKAQLQRPFAIVRFVPNMNDPDVRHRMLDNLLPATAAVYGPPTTMQVGTGQIDDAEEAPDDDEPVDGEFVEKPANGHTNTVNTGTGEIVAQTPTEPDWFGEGEPTADAAADLVNRLRKALGRKPATGPATKEQRESLKALLHEISIEEVLAGLQAAFDYEAPEGQPQLKALAEGQAAAMLAVSDELGRDAFRAAWRAVAQ